MGDAAGLIRIEVDGIGVRLDAPTAESVAPLLRTRVVLRPPAARPPDLVPVAERVAPLLAEAGVAVAGPPSLWLRDPVSRRVLRFEIGQAEADASAVHRQGLAVRRPMTHDLMKTLAEVGGLRVERASVTRRDGDTYHASVTVRRRGGRRAEIDARPSDAVNLALRAGAPVYVAADLLQDPPPAEERP